jgi:hypothetical protein
LPLLVKDLENLLIGFHNGRRAIKEWPGEEAGLPCRTNLALNSSLDSGGCSGGGLMGGRLKSEKASWSLVMNPFCSGFLTAAKNCPDRVRVAPQTISANKKPLSSLEPLAKSATTRAGGKLSLDRIAAPANC